MGFPKQEFWSGLPFPSPGDLLNPGIEPASFMSPVLAGEYLTTVPPKYPWLHTDINKCLHNKWVNNTWTYYQYRIKNNLYRYSILKEEEHESHSKIDCTWLFVSKVYHVGKGWQSNFTVEKPDEHHVSRAIKLKSTVIHRTDSKYPE